MWREQKCKVIVALVPATRGVHMASGYVDALSAEFMIRGMHNGNNNSKNVAVQYWVCIALLLQYYNDSQKENYP